MANAENNKTLQFLFLFVLICFYLCCFCYSMDNISSIAPYTFWCICFLLVSLVLSCICISISMGDGWMHPECWFTDAICSCGKWSVSNSDREKRRKRSKRKENYFLFRSSYHAVPRNFEYLFYYRELNEIPQNSYGYVGFLQNISNRFAADFTKLNREGIKASSFAPKTFLKSGKTFS